MIARTAGNTKQLLKACLFSLIGAILSAAPVSERIDPSFQLEVHRESGGAASFVSLPGGKLLVSGWFEMIGDHPTTNLARLNLDGSIDKSVSFSSEAAGRLYRDPSGKVYALTSNNTLTRFLQDGSIDRSFNFDSPTPPGQLFGFAGTKLLIGNGTTAQLLNESGTVEKTFPLKFNSRLLPLASGKILEHSPTIVSGLNNDGSPDPSFTPLQNIVRAYALPGRDEFITSEFVDPTNYVEARIVWRQLNGEVKPGFQPVVIDANPGDVGVISDQGGVVTLISLDLDETTVRHSRLGIGGELSPLFTTSIPQYGFSGHFGFEIGAPRPIALTDGSYLLPDPTGNSIAKHVTSSGDLIRDIDHPFYNSEGLAGSTQLDSNRFAIFGNFDLVNRQPARHLAVIDTNGALVQTFPIPEITNAPAVRKVILQPDGNLLVITGVWSGGETADPGKLIRVTATGGLDSTLNLSNIEGDVRDALILRNGKLLLSGSFVVKSSGEVTAVLKLKGDGSVDDSFHFADPAYRGGSLAEMPDGRLVSSSSSSVLLLEENGSILKYLYSFPGTPWVLEDSILVSGSELIDFDLQGNRRDFFGTYLQTRKVEANTGGGVRLPDGSLALSGWFSSTMNGLDYTTGIGLIHKREATLQRIYTFPELTNGVQVLAGFSQQEVLAQSYYQGSPVVLKLRLSDPLPPVIRSYIYQDKAHLLVTSEVWTNLSILASTNATDWTLFKEITLSTNSPGVFDADFRSTPNRYFKAVVHSTPAAPEN